MTSFPRTMERLSSANSWEISKMLAQAASDKIKETFVTTVRKDNDGRSRETETLPRSMNVRTIALLSPKITPLATTGSIGDEKTIWAA